MPGIEVRVGDPETREELPRGEVGEISVPWLQRDEGLLQYAPTTRPRPSAPMAGCTPATLASWMKTAICG